MRLSRSSSIKTHSEVIPWMRNEGWRVDPKPRINPHTRETHISGQYYLHKLKKSTEIALYRGTESIHSKMIKTGPHATYMNLCIKIYHFCISTERKTQVR